MKFGKRSSGSGRSPEVVAAEERERARGYEAAERGEADTSNPFPEFTGLGKVWLEGYNLCRNGLPLRPPGENTGTSEPAKPEAPPPPVSTPAPPRVATPAPPPVSTPEARPSSRPTVRVPPALAPYPRCPGCSKGGGTLCPNTCSHRRSREEAARAREVPAAPVVEARPEAPPPPVEEEEAPLAKVVPFRVLSGGEAAPDPQAEHRAFLVELLEETLEAVRAGHIDGGFFVVHHSPTHPTGCGWATAFSGNVDLVHRLGALELAKADILRRSSPLGGE